MLNDGFGNTKTIDEVIESHDHLARIIASERVSPDAPFDDVLQEERIAVWRAALTRPGDDLRGLASVVMRRRANEVATRQTWTGSGGDGRKRRADVLREQRDSLDSLLEDVGFAVAAPDLLEDVEWSYHHGEIAEALAALTPTQRTYVILRFWLRYTEPEIAGYLGTTTKSVSSAWDRAKPVLQDRLEHLV